MKLRVFQSDKGDCLLLTSSDNRHVLIDGGMGHSYRKHVAPHLDTLRAAGDKLDLVCVSHIDQDHIAGILEMMDDMVDWRVYRYHHDTVGNTHFRPPDSVEPPAVDRIWHNAFHAQVGENAGAIADMLAANASLLSLLRPNWAKALSITCTELATSEAQAMQLSQRIGARQLNIPLNPEYAGGLMFVSDPGAPMVLGKLNITVIGPFGEDLEVLRAQWNTWLESQRGRTAVDKIRRESVRDEERLRWSELDLLLKPIELQAAELGDRNKVTPPNLASLMLLVEEEGRTVLLTGDGHWEDILAGLETVGALDAAGQIHVDVLKVQHHGSEHNINVEFCRRVTADHYVFCGNGAHENPDTRVIDTVIASRVGPQSRRSTHPSASRRFFLWFNSSPDASEHHADHMTAIQQQVNEAIQTNSGHFGAFFLKDDFFDIPLTTSGD